MRTPLLSVWKDACWHRTARQTLVSFALCVLAATSYAQKLTFRATLDGAQEVPPTGSTATGTGYFVMDRIANKLDYCIEFSGLSSAEIGAHIHGFAPAGSNAGVLFGLPPGSPKIGTVTFAESDEASIIAGLAYVNVHSGTFPNGEIRGQILLDATPANYLQASLNGAQEVPPTPSPATGSASFSIDTVANRLCFNVSYSGLTSAETGAHIHSGAPGVNGPILFPLPAGSPKTGVWTYPEAQEAAILGGLTYVNVHSSMFPGGEIRGQIVPITNPTVYCSGKVNSQGCVPAMGFSGVPSASMGPDNFMLTCSNTINNKSGLMFWGTAPNNAPFMGGILCARPPLVRTMPQNSGGNPPPNDCSGGHSFHFSQAYMAANGLAAGSTVYGEWWMRDPTHPDGTGVGFSNACQFVILP